ncbi:MAG TPA: hypothetical protein VG754_06500 [Verrucomicrobiae bacterium]|nr:hypothetical protein [Verrucomicrobiae bacterium]
MTNLLKKSHWRAGSKIKNLIKKSGGFFSYPFTDMQVLLDFPAFIPVFLGFFGLVVGFAEGMFVTTYGFTEYFQRFYHNWHSFLQGYTSVSHANPADVFLVSRQGCWHQSRFFQLLRRMWLFGVQK